MVKCIKQKNKSKRVYVYIPETPMTPMCEGQPLKTRPFRNKTRVIWVEGIYSYSFQNYLFDIVRLFLQDTSGISAFMKLRGHVNIIFSPCQGFRKKLPQGGNKCHTKVGCKKVWQIVRISRLVSTHLVRFPKQMRTSWSNCSSLMKEKCELFKLFIQWLWYLQNSFENYSKANDWSPHTTGANPYVWEDVLTVRTQLHLQNVCHVLPSSFGGVPLQLKLDELWV